MSPTSTTCKACYVPAVGVDSATWLGGFTFHRKGYLMVKVEGKYLFQHRLVMQSILGRELLPTENVHHKNGNKADNRPDNLELWVRSQPAGQRVEDLVKWAKEILATYEPKAS